MKTERIAGQSGGIQSGQSAGVQSGQSDGVQVGQSVGVRSGQCAGVQEEKNASLKNRGTKKHDMTDRLSEEPAKNTPVVSVIVPVYNAEAYLPSCLDCVLSQTLKEIEVICVNDGSTDGSAGILAAYAARDARVRTLTMANHGAGAARNAGLKLARGRYVVFWDADDSFRRDALEKMSARCEKYSADLCICSAMKRDDETGTVYATGAYLRKKLLPRQEIFNRRTIPQYIFNVSGNVPWNKMLRRDFLLLNGLHFQEIPQTNDVFFSMTAIYRARRICVVKEPLVTYRVENRGSLTGIASEYDLCTVEAFAAVKAELDRSTEFVMSPKLQQSFDNRVADALFYSLRKQWNIDAYRYLYGVYKNEVFPDLGLVKRPPEYYYDPDIAEDIRRMQELDADSFLLYLLHRYERRYLMAAGMTPAQLLRKVERKVGQKVLPGRKT